MQRFKLKPLNKYRRFYTEASYLKESSSGWTRNTLGLLVSQFAERLIDWINKSHMGLYGPDSFLSAGKDEWLTDWAIEFILYTFRKKCGRKERNVNPFRIDKPWWRKVCVYFMSTILFQFRLVQIKYNTNLPCLVSRLYQFSSSKISIAHKVRMQS